MQTGYYARTPDKELKCFDLEFNVLMSIDDVTDRVKGAVKGAKDPADAQKRRQEAINTIEKEATDDTAGMKGEVVTLYRGGLYHLYHYKKYNDVRLVFAPSMPPRFSAAIATTSSIPATTSTSASSASTRTASRSTRNTT